MRSAHARPIGENPKGYYTAEYQKTTRAKIERISSPMLIIHSDQEPTLVRFNNEVLIPELRAAGKELEVKSVSGEPHCFAFNGQAAQPANVIKALEDAELFVRELRPPGFVGFDDLCHLDWCTKGAGVIKQTDSDW